jgi:hypothetical protein
MKKVILSPTHASEHLKSLHPTSLPVSKATQYMPMGKLFDITSDQKLQVNNSKLPATLAFFIQQCGTKTPHRFSPQPCAPIAQPQVSCGLLMIIPHAPLILPLHQAPTVCALGLFCEW